MAFPELEYRTEPIRETEADAILLALPPLEGDDSPALADWPGVTESLLAVGFTGGAVVADARARPREHDAPAGGRGHRGESGCRGPA